MAVNPHDIHTYHNSFIEDDTHVGESYNTAVLHKLENIHNVLQAILLSTSGTGQKEIMDERYIQTLFKAGLGANWIPNRRGKFYIYVQAPVATALNISGPLGSPYVLTIPAPTLPGLWNLLDIPDQSSIILDSTAASNQMNLFVLLTDMKL